MLSDVPSKILTSPGRYAVMLNARAKQWTGDLHEDVARWVPARDLYLTDDFNQAERTVDKLISEDYDVIFTGGGDGTIVYLMNAIEGRIRDGMVSRDEAPMIGVLRMGTGNALASYVGSGPIVEDLRALKAGKPLTVYSVNMIESAEGMFPFAGFGWDALILNDYDALKDAVRSTSLENYVTGLGGYALSVATRSVPGAIKQGRSQVRLVANDQAFRIDDDGNILEEFEDGDTLYEGPTRVCGVGSIPYWGFKIRMFPHCSVKPGFFEMRTYHGSVSWIVTHLHRFWQGELEPGKYTNFLCSDVRCEFLDEGLPYQVAGDARGNEKIVEWRMAEFPARLAVPMR